MLEREAFTSFFFLISRLRRRQAHVRFTENEPEIINGLQRGGLSGRGSSSGNREALSWMVDNVRLDHLRLDQAANASLENAENSINQMRDTIERSAAEQAAAASNSSRNRPGTNSSSTSAYTTNADHLYGIASDHASFRTRYINRIRPEDGPRSLYRYDNSHAKISSSFYVN